MNAHGEEWYGIQSLYLDTPDALLRARGATCRLRVSASGRATLTLVLLALLALCSALQFWFSRRRVHYR